MSNDQVFPGVVHGKSVELLLSTGLPDGAEVEIVTSSPEWTSEQRKQRLETLFGSCQADAASLDDYLEANAELRGRNRHGQAS